MAIKRHGVGPRMSMCVVHGDTVYLAGHVARDPAGKSVGEQTQDILDQIDAALKAAGTSKSKLLSANIWLTDMATFGEMNAVWDAWVSPGNTPARATVQAPLATPDYKVEIMAVAGRTVRSAPASGGGGRAASAKAGKAVKGKAAKAARPAKAAKAAKAPARKKAAKPAAKKKGRGRK
jgi:enamine deaminase RidA (YjgF/YER057c/UK114 family)